MTENNEDIIKYQQVAKKIRKLILKIAYETQTHHLGSAFSCVDLLVALYFHTLRIDPKNPNKKNRDWFVLSKGHASLGLYVTLAFRGFFPFEILKEYALDGGRLGIHPDKGCVPGVEMSTGSLGHGLSISAGVALAAKKDNLSHRAFVLLGDGECNEGTVWEASLFASHHELDNLIAIVDYNRLQALGTTDEVLKLDPLCNKFKAFGWGVKEIDGHNMTAIISTFDSLPIEKDKPNMIIAHTVKGKGISFLEGKFESHYICLTNEQYKQALKELGF